MQDKVDRLEITEIVIRRRRICRAFLVGGSYAIFIGLSTALHSIFKRDYFKALGFLVIGGMLFMLSLQLRKANRVAAHLLMPVFMLSLVPATQELLVHVKGQRWSLGAQGGVLLLLMFGVLGYFIVSGVAAAITFKRTGSSHSLESLNFGSLESSPTAPKAKKPNLESSVFSIKALQMSSEVALLAGAGLLLLNTILPILGKAHVAYLSLAGIILLALGVRSSLHALRRAEIKARASLAGDARPRVLILRSGKDEFLKVRSKASFRRPFISSFPTITLAQVINENLSALGPVVIDSVVNEPFPTFGQRRNFTDRARWQQRGKSRILDCRSVAMIIGKNESLIRRFSREAELNFLNKGMLIFPPVDESQMRDRWDNLRRRADDDWQLSPLSDLELKRAVLLLFRRSAPPLLVLADKRDEWAYEVAFRVAVETIYRDDMSGVPQPLKPSLGEPTSRSLTSDLLKYSERRLG